MTRTRPSTTTGLPLIFAPDDDRGAHPGHALALPRCRRCGTPRRLPLLPAEHPAFCGMCAFKFQPRIDLELDDGDSEETWRERDRRWQAEYDADHPPQDHFTV